MFGFQKYFIIKIYSKIDIKNQADLLISPAIEYGCNINSLDLALKKK